MIYAASEIPIKMMKMIKMIRMRMIGFFLWFDCKVILNNWVALHLKSQFSEWSNHWSSIIDQSSLALSTIQHHHHHLGKNVKSKLKDLTKQHLLCKSWRQMLNVCFFWGTIFSSKHSHDEDHENPILWIIWAQGNILSLHPELISTPDTL